MNKKSQRLTKGIIISIFLISIFSFVFVLAEQLDNPKIDDYNLEEYKIHNYNDVYIFAKKVHHCSWKPDSINDGYKVCRPEIIIWNKRDNAINMSNGAVLDTFQWTTPS